jgi:hypothetical protein
MILYTIFVNVFVAPWGLASTQQAGAGSQDKKLH